MKTSKTTALNILTLRAARHWVVNFPSPHRTDLIITVGQQGTPTAYTPVVWQALSVVSRLVPGGTSCCRCGAFSTE